MLLTNEQVRWEREQLSTLLPAKSQPRCIASEKLETAILIADRAIALAGFLFQCRAVDDDEASFDIADGAPSIKSSDCQRYGRAGRTEHVGEGLLSNIDFVSVQPVMAEKKPPCESF